MGGKQYAVLLNQILLVVSRFIGRHLRPDIFCMQTLQKLILRLQDDVCKTGHGCSIPFIVVPRFSCKQTGFWSLFNDVSYFLDYIFLFIYQDIHHNFCK